MKKVLLTGADGLLGSNITRELLHRGYGVTALIERNKQPKTLSNLPGLTLVAGDILDPVSLTEAMRGHEFVIHAAANTNVFPARSEIVRKVNLDGTRHIIDAALLTGVARVVMVTSAVSFGYGTKDQPGDETQPYRSAWIGLDYMDSKYEAHVETVKAVKERGLPAVLVCPTFMLGPYDSRPSSGAMVMAVYEGKVPGYTGGGRNYIDVRDAAIGVCNALTMGRIGEAYVLGHRNMNYHEAFGMMADVMGVKPPRIQFPNWAIKTLGLWGNFWYRLTGKAPLLSYEMAKNSCEGFYFTAAKAVDELQLPQSPIEDAIKACFDWMMEQGMMKKPKA